MLIDNRVNGNTVMMALIGNPIEHSISPQLHNTISNLIGLNAIYIPFKVEKENLEDAVKGFKALDVLGFNITVPYKKDIMKYINDNSKEALLMGAVNTVKKIDGRLYGYNTDAEGFARSFKEEARSDFKNKNIFIIGAGGAARAMAVKIAFEGAKNISIVNRTEAKAIDIADIINNNIDRIAKGYSLEFDNIKELFMQSDIIINTTSVGMYPKIDEYPLDLDSFEFNSNQIVYDVIYNPAKTKFLSLAENKGCKIINGLGMLFYQGIFAYEIWIGRKLSGEVLNLVFKDFSKILGKK